MGAAYTSSYQATQPDWHLLGIATRTSRQIKPKTRWVGKSMRQTCAWRHLRHCPCQKQAIDEDGVVVDILLREYRDTASAEAFFRQTIERSGVIPSAVVTDHHQPYVKAVATTCPGAQHIRTGLHRVRGETTKAVERSHVPMRDRLRNSRGLKRTATGQRFLEGFEAVRRLRRGGSPGAGHLVRGQPATCAFGRSWRRSTPSVMVCVGSTDRIHKLGKLTLRDGPLGPLPQSALNKFPNSS